jgi:DNA-binding MarR family transcriptional regulator
MTDSVDKIYEKAWVGLTRGHQAILVKIEGALRQADLPSLSWYDVLLELSRDETAGMRALELESKLLLPQYGLSRLLDRIEKAGYIERQVCKADRRGKVLYITQSGEDIRQRMWPVYQKAILDILGERLSKKEAEQFVHTLSKLRA